MKRILLIVLALSAACAEDPSVTPTQEVVVPPLEIARTAVTAENEAKLFIGKLNWGKDPTTNKPWTVETLRQLRDDGKGPLANEVRRTLTKAEQAEKNPPATPTIDHLFLMAFCARVATETTQAGCKGQFRSALFGSDDGNGWLGRVEVGTYPVEQASSLTTLFRAVDLFFPLMTLDEKSVTRVWLHGFSEQSDRKGLGTWRLSGKLTASILLEDEKGTRATQEQLRKQVVTALSAPDGWKPDRSCRNNRDEKLFGSAEFRKRDALLYHGYDVQAWTTVLGAKSDGLDSTGQALVGRALDFLKPYYTGRKVHREFVCTAVAADRQYQQKRWRRDSARAMLRAAEPYFPTINSWAKPALDDNHTPSVKLVAALQSAR